MLDYEESLIIADETFHQLDIIISEFFSPNKSKDLSKYLKSIQDELGLEDGTIKPVIRYFEESNELLIGAIRNKFGESILSELKIWIKRGNSRKINRFRKFYSQKNIGIVLNSENKNSINKCLVFWNSEELDRLV